MPKKQPSLTVRMKPVFARDHQRRLRLVIDLLEQETHRQQQALVETQPATLRVAAAAPNSPEGRNENCRNLRACF